MSGAKSPKTTPMTTIQSETTATGIEAAAATTAPTADTTATTGLGNTSPAPSTPTATPINTSHERRFVDATSEIGVVDLLRLDPRPTFVLDLAPNSGTQYVHHPDLVYCNPAMLESVALKDIVTSTFTDIELLTRTENEFSKWATQPQNAWVSKYSFPYVNYSWTLFTLNDRWRVVSGVQNASAAFIADSISQGEVSAKSPFQFYQPEEAALPIHEAISPTDEPDLPNSQSLPAPTGVTRAKDWTYSLTRNGITPHLQVFLNADWASTEIGPMAGWPPQLQLLTYLVMIDPNPAIVLWGNSLTLIYNEAFIPIVGRNKYPEVVGKSFRQTFPEVFAVPEMMKFYDGIFARARLTGQTTRLESQKHFLLQPNGLEERYFCYSYLPVQDSTGKVVGFYEPCVENTSDILSHRRHETVRAVGALTEGQTNFVDFWANLVKGCQENIYDLPFMLAYSLRKEEPPSIEPLENDGLVYEQSLGLPAFDGIVRPLAHSLLMADPNFMEATQRARSSREPVIFQIQDPALAQSLSVKQRGFGDTPKQLLICAMRPTTSVHGILVIGMNSRREYDADYQRFIELLTERASLSLASIMLLTEHERAVQVAAASESRFRKMIELSPVGAFMMRENGQMVFVNQSWIDITGYEEETHTPMSWVSVIHEDDIPTVEQEFYKLSKMKENVEVELRLKKSWEVLNPITGEAVQHPRWMIAAACVYQSADDGSWFIIGSLTDISRQKYNEHLERRRTQEAIEMKRQQENFIDMTSHEIRNPLSAIFQCADMITASLSSVQKYLNRQLHDQSCHDKAAESLLSDSLAELESSIDSAKTISLCSQHQKRIVDDVLTLSKLDSALLELTPVSIEPKVVTQDALEMFSAEFSAADVQMDFCVEQSYYDLDIDRLMLDSSRLVQVLINLIGNALKFTKEQDVRRITVTIGASSTSPSGQSNAFSYISPSKHFSDPTIRPDWGRGEPVYLVYKVQDTGCGINDHDLTQIFEKFIQANPRTHITYGGSGLGLHIARELSEMQGGGIGVTSQSGAGSTFAFFIKTRRSNAPGILPPTQDTSRMNRKPLRVNSEPIRITTISSMHQNIVPSPKRNIYSVLIVEDNLVNQKVLKKQLEKLGWTVSIANHGIEALDYLKRTQYWVPTASSKIAGEKLDVVLMDIEMPIMDGLTCVREIRRLQQERQILGHVPIIAVSANARVEQITNAKVAGVDDVVSKPFRIPELVAKVGFQLDRI